MENHELEKWIDRLLSMAMARCGNIEDAEDLAQETMLVFLAYQNSGKSIDNTEAFLRSVLSRKYYDTLRRKYRLPTVTMGSMLTMGNGSAMDITDKVSELAMISKSTMGNKCGMADEGDFLRSIIRREDAEMVRREVSFLVQSYRSIIAEHYFHGKSIKAISEKTGLPEGTIKSRLDFGRKQLKKGFEAMEKYTENSYMPLHLMVRNSGTCGLGEEPISLADDDNPLAQNLLILAYEKPIGISDLSKAIGVASAYVEPVVNKLVKGELMKRMGDGRVYTDFIIYHRDDFTKYIKEQEDFVSKYAPAYFEALRTAIRKLKDTSFYSLRLERYMLINIAESGLWRALTDCRAPQVFPKRPNGGQWIAFGTIMPDFDPIPAGRQGKEEYGYSGQRCTSLDKYLDSGCIKLYNYETSLYPCPKYNGFGLNTYQETEAGILKLLYLIKHGIAPETVDCDPRILQGIPLLEERGYLTVQSGRPQVLIPCLTPSEEKIFWDICKKASEDFALQIKAPLSEYVAKHKKAIPAHLKSVPDQKLTMPYEPNAMMFVFEAINKGIHPRNLGCPCPETFAVME